MAYGRVDTAYLDAAKAGMLDAKQRSIALLRLQPGMSVLEVGCGPATDTLELAELVGPEGTVVGIDHDPDMVATANERATAAGLADRVTHLRADATALPFEDEAFDAARSERVFQHLPDPRAALAEMARVVRIGGTVEVFDNDWGMIAADSSEPELVQRVSRFMVDQRLITTPYIGRTLYRLFREARLNDVRVELVTPQIHEYEQLMRIAQMDELERIAMQAGVITAEEAARLRASFERAHTEGTLFAAGVMMLATGTKGQVSGSA